MAANDVLAFNLTQIASERDQRIAEYQTQRKLGRLSEQELADRTAAVSQIAELQAERARQIANESNQRDAVDKAQAQANNERDLLQAQEALTTSRKDRLAIELRLIDLAYEQEKIEQTAIMTSRVRLLGANAAKDAQWQIAAERLNMLDKLKGAQVQQAQQQSEGPLASYTRGLRATDTQDQVEGYVVDELQHVQDGISGALQKAIGTKDPLISGLISMFIQNVIMRPIADALSRATSGGGGGGLIGTILGGIGGLLGGGKLSGLSSTFGDAAVANVPNFNLPKFAFGGYTGNGDASQPAGIVHKGEYVVPADAVRRIGVANLAAMAGGGAAASMARTSAIQPMARAQPSIVRVELHEGAMFEPRVQAISGDVSAQVVRGAAPSLIDASARETMARASRVRM